MTTAQAERGGVPRGTRSVALALSPAAVRSQMRVISEGAGDAEGLSPAREAAAPVAHAPTSPASTRIVTSTTLPIRGRSLTFG
jgi:hypothetical protein